MKALQGCTIMNKKSTTGTKITLIMTIAVLCGFGIILAMNMAAMVGIVPSKYISPNDVRGMAVEHKGKLFTLNFQQQNELVDIFNRSIPIEKKAIDGRTTSGPSPEVTKIVIYRFGASDIEITPITYVTKSSSAIRKASQQDHVSLVFSAPEWNKTGYLEEAAADEMHKVLLTTYDH